MCVSILANFGIIITTIVAIIIFCDKENMRGKK